MKRRNFIKIVSFGGVLTVATKLSVDSLAGETNGAVKGKRWAMVIDTRICSTKTDACRSCIDACIREHNIPFFNSSKDEIKWIWRENFHNAFVTSENPFLPEDVENRNVPLLCNHCANPPCTNVCPTQATWKRDDGIVMMDWHRCIGCRYCIAACPYGSRSFNWREPREFISGITDNYPTRTKGVVEKCTFCDERIAKGQKPACVTACTGGAMMFGDINDKDSDVRQALIGNFSIRRKPELGTSPEVFYIV